MTLDLHPCSLGRRDSLTLEHVSNGFQGVDGSYLHDLTQTVYIVRSQGSSEGPLYCPTRHESQGAVDDLRHFHID